MTKYTIQIPNPCTENWNTMTPTERGKFCSNCKKEVINYQYYSNNQLFKSLNNDEKICGRFSPYQINIELKATKTNPLYQLGLFLGFSSLLLSTPVYSQNGKSKMEIVESKSDDELKQKSSDEFVEFYGKIIGKATTGNENSYSIQGVNIVQKSTKNSVQSNFDGDFKIKIPLEDFRDEVTLVFNYIGMETKEVKLSTTKNHLKIEMIVSNVLMGEVVIVKYKKRNIFTRIGKVFKKNTTH
ncbi:carboxypeptidase-like regulatory domain-containing protein [Flavobacterium sandaracinum]|uniref:Carboxypeptidase-like regulatory domain-containing protein n=1 Tax=Flavobacterium sandaracinum TaxID=2541733 RepID=A0A4R5CIY8_9FLAO|nr:carboxypeptidase-like regulatory domain-containing protein [Flavobacterium sandaracinum]TDD99096.1 hypothetical protein E0F91_17390 [Flavobacterium sandaracinum]